VDGNWLGKHSQASDGKTCRRFRLVAIPEKNGLSQVGMYVSIYMPSPYQIPRAASGIFPWDTTELMAHCLY